MTCVSDSDEKIVIQDDVENALRLEMFTFAEKNKVFALIIVLPNWCQTEVIKMYSKIKSHLTAWIFLK